MVQLISTAWYLKSFETCLFLNIAGSELSYSYNQNVWCRRVSSVASFNTKIMMRISTSLKCRKCNAWSSSYERKCTLADQDIHKSTSQILLLVIRMIVYCILLVYCSNDKRKKKKGKYCAMVCLYQFNLKCLYLVVRIVKCCCFFGADCIVLVILL